jgi:hypothetical protein
MQKQMWLTEGETVFIKKKNTKNAPINSVQKF